jgi:protein-arginine kinase activator protein McsA
MPCDRCGQRSTVLYLLHTKTLEIMVCHGCAEIAVDLGITGVEVEESLAPSSA